MKVITLPANTYHKVGTELDLDDNTANILINKGFAEAVSGTNEEVKPKPKKNKK